MKRLTFVATLLRSRSDELREQRDRWCQRYLVASAELRAARATAQQTADNRDFYRRSRQRWVEACADLCAENARMRRELETATAGNGALADRVVALESALRGRMERA